MRPLFSLGLVLALALPLLSVTRPAAAATTPQRLASATAPADFLVVSFRDAADGKITRDAEANAEVIALFANTVWEAFDDGTILVSQSKAGKLEPILTFLQVGNEADTFFVFHRKASGGKLFFNGSFGRSTDDPTQGFTVFTVLQLRDNGDSVSSFVSVSLKFQP